MLTPVQANERLKDYKAKDAKKRRLAAVAKLPKPLAEIARGLLGVGPDGKAIGNYEKRNAAHAQARQRLDEQTPANRQKLFAAFLPKLAAALEAGWQLGKRLPYETGDDRRAFRAPSL